MKRSGRCLVGDNSKVGSDHPFRDSASICPPVFEVFARRQKNSYGSLRDRRTRPFFLGVKIWDGNGSKEFLQGRGLAHRREGDLGPVHGFQWRHFEAKYEDCEREYDGEEADQLKECIRKIKENPTDRRIIPSAWNPAGECLRHSVRLRSSIHPSDIP